MRQQEKTEYLPGTTVFAKLKGYPWWPARIEPDEAVPEQVLKQKAKTKGTLYTVFFYGSKDYGFFGPDAIRPFDSVLVENDLASNKFKTKDLIFAIEQALQGTRKNKNRKLVQHDVDETAISENPKRRRKSASVEDEEEDRVDFKQTHKYKKVYLIRHRLQRLVYNKKEGEISQEDYPAILEIIKEIEEMEMTYSLLKETKIGKVVKSACSYPFEDDDISDRCQQLMRSWKLLIIDSHTSN